MKKALIIIIILITLIIVLMIGRDMPFGTKNSAFHVEKTGKISRILISGDENEIDLRRKAGEWYLNDDQPVRPSAIDFILKTIREIRIKSPVSQEMYNELLGRDSTRHVEVKIYDKNRLIRSFHIYTGKGDEFPGLVQKDKRAKPFTVHMPGYDIDPLMNFVTAKNFWLPDIIFEVPPGNISEISLTYHNMPDSSFIIRHEGDKLAFENDHYAGEDIDTMALGRYLSYFSYIPFEQRILDEPVNTGDPLKERDPYFNLELITGDADTIDLLTWKRYIYDGNERIRDTDRLWGSMNRGEDIFIISYYDLDPVIKYPSYFISE